MRKPTVATDVLDFLKNPSPKKLHVLYPGTGWRISARKKNRIYWDRWKRKGRFYSRLVGWKRASHPYDIQLVFWKKEKKKGLVGWGEKKGKFPNQAVGSILTSIPRVHMGSLIRNVQQRLIDAKLLLRLDCGRLTEAGSSVTNSRSSKWGKSLLCAS